MSAITEQTVVDMVDRHGYFTIQKRGSFHTAYIKVKHPDMKFLMALRAAIGFGRVWKQKWKTGEVSWLIFEGPAAAKLAFKLKGFPMAYQHQRLALILEFGYHLAGRKKKLSTIAGAEVKFSPKLSEEDRLWREEMKRKVEEAPEPPKAVREDFTVIKSAEAGK